MDQEPKVNTTQQPTPEELQQLTMDRQMAVQELYRAMAEQNPPIDRSQFVVVPAIMTVAAIPGAPNSSLVRVKVAFPSGDRHFVGQGTGIGVTVTGYGMWGSFGTTPASKEADQFQLTITGGFPSSFLLIDWYQGHSLRGTMAGAGVGFSTFNPIIGSGQWD